MKKNLLISLLALCLFSCNAPDKRVLTEEDQLSLVKEENDSLMIIFDSLMQLKVNVPQLIDSTFISVECLEDFNRLARETGGSVKILANSKFVTKTILDIIKNNSADNSDLMIIIDKTSSMADDLDNIKKGIDQILNALRHYQNLRLAVSTYGDKNVDGKLWYDFHNFENDFGGTSRFIHKIQMTHGGDAPESVYDGIYKAFQENFWRSDSKRMVILLGDAPSLDSTLSEHGIKDVIEIAKHDRINMNFYPIVLNPFLGEVVNDDEPRMEKMNLIKNIYPNPTNGPLSIELHNENGLAVELIDQRGSIVKSVSALGSMEKMDLYAQANGLYIIRVYDKFKNFDDRKIIVNK